MLPLQCDDAVTLCVVGKLDHRADRSELGQLLEGGKVVGLDHAFFYSNEEKLIGAGDCQGLPSGREKVLVLKESEIVRYNLHHRQSDHARSETTTLIRSLTSLQLQVPVVG